MLMVINHTSRDWLDPALRWPRYYLIYGSLLLPAAIFLFLVGFVLPVPYHRNPQPAGPTAWRYFRRGIRVMAGGYLLNLVVIRSQPVWSGGVLQTIGLSIIVLGLILPLMAHPWTRGILFGLAVAGYLAFGAAVPALTRWSVDHPIVARALLKDFPPWPWISAALLGLVGGWTWLEARKKGGAHENRFFGATAVLGVVLLLAYGVWEWWIPTTPRFGFARDFGLNGHWSPRGVTTFLVLGGVLCLLALTFWLMERRHLTAPWLVTLGQTALILYFVHQLIELTLVSEILGIRMTHWSVYWITNATFVVVLVYLGRAWLAIKARWRARSTWGARDAPPRAPRAPAVD